MKKNQLFGILALMMALGMSFPATTFSSCNSQPKTEPADLNFELMDEGPDLKLDAMSDSSQIDDLEESTSETGTLPSEEQEGKDEDEEDDDDDDKDKNKDDDDNNKARPADDEPELNTASVNPKTIRNYADLIAILQDESIMEIRLVNDLIVDGDIEFGRSTPTILDLNGHSIISCGNDIVGCENARVINVEYGTLTITGKGNIMAMGPNGVAVSIRGSVNETTSNYATVEIGPEVNLLAPNSHGVLIAPSANASYGINLELKGGVSADNGVYVNGGVRNTGKNAPKIHISNSAIITAEKTAILAAGYADWKIDAATIASTIGVDAHTGNFVFSGTNVTANGPDLVNGTDDIKSAAFQFNAKDSNHVNLAIDGGTYRSAQGFIFSDLSVLNETESSINSLEIIDGVFVSPIGIFDGFEIEDNEIDDVELSTVIRGGRFSADVTDFLAPGMHLESTDNNDYIVIDENALEVLRAKAELQALVDTARSKDETFYTVESYRKLTNCIKETEAIFAQENTTLDQVDKLTIALNKALNALELISTVDPGTLVAARQELINTIGSIKVLDPTKYDVSDYQELMDLVAAAETLLARPGVTYEDIESMLGEIDATCELLMIYDEEQAMITARLSLESLIEEVNLQINNADTTDSSFDALRTLLVNASALISDDVEPSRDELESMYIQLSGLSDKLFTNLGQLSAPNPETEVSQTVNNSSQINNLKIENADSGNPDRTVTELRSGLLEMLEAVTGLTIGDYRSDFTSQYYDLQAAITEAKELLIPQDAPSSELAEVMNKILVATSGLKDATSDQSETFNAPATTLEPSIPESPTLDTTVLGEIISRIAKLDSSKYTTESYSIIISILKQAKVALANSNTTQADIDQIVLNLYQATMDLVSVSIRSNPSSYGSSSQVQSYSQPDAVNNASVVITPNTSATAATTSSPQTVTEDTVAPSLMMSALAGMYTGLAMYRKSRIAAKNAKIAKRRQK